MSRCEATRSSRLANGRSVGVRRRTSVADISACPRAGGLGAPCAPPLHLNGHAPYSCIYNDIVIDYGEIDRYG